MRSLLLPPASSSLLLVGFTALLGSCSFVRDFDEFSAQCQTGTAECVADDAVSCETNIDDDHENCGGCGITCAATDYCGGGTCLQYRVNLGIQQMASSYVNAATIADAANGGLFLGYNHNTDISVLGTVVPATNSDASLLRVNRRGDVNWAISMTSVVVPETERIESLVATNYGVVAATTFRSANVDLSQSSGASVQVANASSPDTDGILWGVNEDGTYRWHLLATGTGNTSFSKVATDGQGNVYAAGVFNGTDLRIGTSANLADGNVSGIFVVKVLSNGARQWTSVFAAPTSVLGAIEVDAAGNVYVFSVSTGAATIGTTTLPGNDTPRLFSLDGTTGAVRWFKSYSGAEPSFAAGDSIVRLPADATHPSGRIFVAFYCGNVASAVGPFQIGQGSAIAEIDPTTGDSANAFLVSPDFRPFGLARDPEGGLILSGYIPDPALTELEVLGQTFPFTSAGMWDIALVGLSTEGTLRFERAFGSAALEYPVRLVVNDYGTIFLSTYLSSDPFTIDGSTFMPNSGIVSSLVLRFDPAGVAPAP